MQTKDLLENLFKEAGVDYSETELWFDTIFSFELRMSTPLQGTLAKIKITKNKPEDQEAAKEYARKVFLVSIIKSSIPSLKEAANERLAKLN